MKAIVYGRYGPPEVLQFKDMDKPAPKDNEVLVQVHGSSANSLGWHRMRGKPFQARPIFQLEIRHDRVRMGA